MKKEEEIDFVLAWVDGNDKEWQKDFQKYKQEKGDKRTARFRDWDNLQYLFRAFEEFTPWVHKIYFITYGHLPKWLNTNHPKLVIVNHKDYMDEKNLPVFNSHPIEINMHRIQGLSEKFVYFNDDTFILQPLHKNIFFKKNLPVNMAVSTIMHNGDLAHIILNNIITINKYTKKRKFKIIFSSPFKWFHPLYGLKMLNTILLLFWSRFTGFKNYHHPQPFLKNTFKELWNKEEILLNKVSASKIRNNSDVNQYLFRYWQFITGNFYPDSLKNTNKKRKYKDIKNKESANNIANDISSKKFQMYCPNDALIDNKDFIFCKHKINEALDNILPNKSSFEI